MNQRYSASAVVPDGTPDPGFVLDPELYHQPSTRPCAKLPHAWVTRGRDRLSTLDLGGRGRFTLFTRVGGDCLGQAAEDARRGLGVETATVAIGPGQEYEGP